jgi:AAA15 family ATPase/GTPase
MNLYPDHTSLSKDELVSRCLKLTLEKNRYEDVLKILSISQMGEYPKQYEREVIDMCKRALSGEDIIPQKKEKNTFELLAETVGKLRETVDIMEKIIKKS